MKLSALALDFDGTISTDDRLSPSVADVIGEVRERGLVVVLVTGRRLDDLHAHAGELHCFDAIVGENGAVLEFPARARRSILGHPPPAAFLEALGRRGVKYQTGECIVETDGSAAGIVLEILHELRLPLVIAFNRGRLMVLPPAIAKSTGLRDALRAMRLSLHNTIGIGDAENDHDMLDACEVGVAVAWGSPALKAAADEVIQGSGPDDVAAYIRAVAAQPRLLAPQMGRRSLLLGHEAAGAPVRLALRGRTILIGGEPGSGKSALAGLLCEQLILQGYCLCMIDPEGDFVSLRSLPGVVVLGGDDPPPTARELARALEYPDVSVVIDLSRTAHQDKVEYVRAVMPLLNTLRRRSGLPHKILLDEAHYYLWPDGWREMIDPELAGYVIVTYRLSALSPGIWRPDDSVALLRRESDRSEAEAVADVCRQGCASTVRADVLASLGAHEAALLPGAFEAHGGVRRFSVAPRLTAHVRHRSKYLDMPIADARAFVFGEGSHRRPQARTLNEFMSLLGTLPPSVLAGHLSRRDFSRWIEDVFRDGPLASHVRRLEAGADGEPGGTASAAAAISQAIRARYEPPTAPAVLRR